MNNDIKMSLDGDEFLNFASMGGVFDAPKYLTGSKLYKGKVTFIEYAQSANIFLGWVYGSVDQIIPQNNFHGPTGIIPSIQLKLI